MVVCAIFASAFRKCYFFRQFLKQFLQFLGMQFFFPGALELLMKTEVSGKTWKRNNVKMK